MLFVILIIIVVDINIIIIDMLLVLTLLVLMLLVLTLLEKKESNPATHPLSNTERCPRNSSPRRCWVIIILKPATDLGHYGTKAQRVAGSI